MQTYISLLRGINVSGKNPLKMAELLVMLQNLNFKNVRTYIQSGNVVFQFKETIHSELKKIISEKISNQFGYKVSVLVINIGDWESIFENNPFTFERDTDLSKLHVTFLSDKPELNLVEKITNTNFAPDKFIISEKAIYLQCPNGYGNTKLSNTFWENKLKVRATTRNWKSITLLMEMAKTISILK